MSDFVNLDGQLLARENAAIAASDAGLLHGAGLFETMRAAAGRVFRLRQHLERLTRSAQALAFPFALEESVLTEMIAELLDANSLRDARLRLTLTRGDLHAATADDPVPPVTLLLTGDAFEPYPADFYANGVTVAISRYRQNPDSPLAGHKTTSHFDRLVALREARELHAVEALWFTAHDNILAEGSISNIFIVDKNGFLATPPLMLPERSGQPARPLCLPGITRQVVMELAMGGSAEGAAASSGLNMLPHERLLTIDDLLAAREVFLTNAIMGVMPVTHIEKHAVANAKPGPITQRLLQAHNAAMTA